MTIATYADLKTQVAAFANRADLTSQIPIFIQLAESRIYAGSMEPPLQCDPLRTSDMEISAYTTISSQRTALPAGFLERRRLYIVDTDNFELKYMPPDRFWAAAAASQTGRPIFFTVEGSELVVAPSPQTTYTAQLLYYKKYDALSSDADTNLLLTNSPGIYLDGALVELWAYLMDMVQQQNALKRFVGRVNALNDAAKKLRHSGTPWVGRVDTPTP